MIILNEKFYGRRTLDVAVDLLGKYLIHNINGQLVGGKIVETEAYTGVTDKAAHVYGGRKTERVLPMYGRAGTSYVYRIYGMYNCLNAITEREGEPQGVLILSLIHILDDFLYVFLFKYRRDIVNNIYGEYALIFKALSDSTRLEILEMIKDKELCACCLLYTSRCV